MDYRFDTVAIVVSQHYRLLKSIVASSTTVRLPTSEEAQLADYLTDVIQAVAGKFLASYCRDRFRQGWMTRDLRSYKIKFALTKLRDRLKNSKEKEELKQRLAELTDRAEQLAGCKTDNKRRNKQAREEQARRQEQKRLEAESKPQQMLLFDDSSFSTSTSGDSSMGISVSEDTLDDVELLVVPTHRMHHKATPEKTEDKPKLKGGKKKSKEEKKFEKMAREILEAEYANDCDEEDDLTDPEDKEEDVFDWGYGTDENE